MDDRSTAHRHSPNVTLRWAAPADAQALEILAELDEAGIPEAPVLVALVEDELWVAMSLSSGVHISDPFRRTADVVALIAERARQLTVPDRPRFALVGPRRRSSATRRFSARAQARW